MNPLTRRRFLLASAAVSLGQSAPSATLDQVRLGITSDEIDEDLLTAAKFLQGFGLDYAELRSIWGKYNTEQPLDRIRAARALLDKHGIKTSILSTAFFKVPLPPDNAIGRGVLDNQFSMLDGAMERAKILGTDKIRVFAFTHREGEKLTGKEYPRIYDLVQEAVWRAKQRNFRLALENVGGSYISTGAEAAELLKAIPDKTLGLTWDPNNAGASGESAFPDGYRKLDPARIYHVHLRDYRHKPDGTVEWCAVGQGEFDNQGQIRALLSSGYKETFTLETHYRSPQGKAHATRTSLTALLKIIEQA